MSRVQPLLAVAHSFIVSECGDLDQTKDAMVVDVLIEFIKFGGSNASETTDKLAVILSRPVSAIQRLTGILAASPEPIPDPPSHLSHVWHKSNPWYIQEDDRLLAGVHKYGLNAWMSVAMFVGNGRSRAQCAQRWNRSLNPQLKKTGWSPADEHLLAELVARYGLKSWTAISQEMVSRSDMQCRYRWMQMQRRTERQIPIRSGRDDELVEAALRQTRLPSWT
jgi:hypothetical protein